MDIYTEKAEYNIQYMIKNIFIDYMETYGIHVIYVYKNNEFNNCSDLFDFIMNDDEYWLEYLIDQLSYNYIYKALDHFIETCPFEICYKNQYGVNRNVK